MRSFRFITFCGGFLLLLGLASSCSKAPLSSPVVLARVGDKAITAEDLLREVERRRQARRPVPAKEDLLREMVAYESMLERARQIGLGEDAELRREINHLIIGKLKERELTARLEAIQIGDEEVQAAYEADRDRYTRPAQCRLAMLHLPANPKISPARKRELQRRMEEARDKALAQSARLEKPAGGFGELSLEYSDDQASRYRGGDLGWVHEGRFDYRWPREVVETGQSLSRGEISEILSLDSGFYLVMKTDDRPGQVTPLSEVKSALAQKLAIERRQQLMAAWQKEIIGEAAGNIDDAALAALSLPALETTVVSNQIPGGPPSFPAGPGVGREIEKDGEAPREF